MQDRMAGAAVVFLLLALPNSYGNTCSQDGAVATILNDPHVRGPFGSTFDFKGEHGCIYSLLSAQHLSFQAKFEHVDFVSPFSKMNVHGAFMREAYAVLDTSKSTRIFIEYGVWQPAVAFIAIGNHKSSITNITNGALKQVDDVLVSLSHNTLYVETSKWKLVMEATSGKPHRGVARLNVGVQPTLPLPAILSPVAPHGLLGQLYDGGNVTVHGKRDVYSRLDDGRASNQRTGVGGHVTTRAMGEGAIEGTASDYLLRHKFETNFTFSRHHNTHAAVRDIRKLHGVKIRAVASKQKLPGRSDMVTRKRGRELSTTCQPTSPPVAPPPSSPEPHDHRPPPPPPVTPPSAPPLNPPPPPAVPQALDVLQSPDFSSWSANERKGLAHGFLGGFFHGDCAQAHAICTHAPLIPPCPLSQTATPVADTGLQVLKLESLLGSMLPPLCRAMLKSSMWPLTTPK